MGIYEDLPCPTSAADACVLRLLLFGRMKAFFALRAPNAGLPRKDRCIVYINFLETSNVGYDGLYRAFVMVARIMMSESAL